MNNKITKDLFNIKSNYPLYLVGGAVRDMLSGHEPKDIDLCMVAPSFEEMEKEVVDLGGEIFVSKPEYLTIRCRMPVFGAVDIAMARVDGDYSDGRRPDFTMIADDIKADLSRRDFSVNAMALNCNGGELIDPFNGYNDLQNKILRCVGSANERFQEDFLRMLRAIRFSICKDYIIHPSIMNCLINIKMVKGLENVSEERIREEITKCFRHNTNATLRFLVLRTPDIADYIFEKTNLWLKPTSEKC